MNIFKAGDYMKKRMFDINIRGQIRRMVVCPCIMMTCLLSGCSGIKNQVLQTAGILDDEDYQNYVDLEGNGQLDRDGFYKDTNDLSTENDSDSTQDGIHVSFAVNSCMDIAYYWDAKLTNPVDVKTCYLKPGDCIYAKEPDCSSPYGSFYCFDGFRIYDYDIETSKRKALLWNENSSDDFVLKVPMDYTGSEIVVEPVGRYKKYALSLDDYYMDSSGSRQVLDGEWLINGSEIRDEHVEMSPVTSYTIDYKYDPDKYEFVASEPNSFSHENGYVRFERTDADSLIERYSVRLQAIGRELPLKIVLTDSVKDIFFRVATFENSKQEDIRYDNGEKTSMRPDWLGGTDRLVFDQQIRMGSDVTIEAENGTLRQECSIKLDIVKKDTDGREYKSVEYISSLPGKGLVSIYEDEAGADSTITYEEIRITISKVETVSYEPQTVPNGSVEVYLSDTDDADMLQKGDLLESAGMVRVTIVPDPDYYVTGSDVEQGVYSDTMSYEDWCADADEILQTHPVKKVRSVTLDSSDDYGTCVYQLDGEVVSGTIKIREGQELTLEYTVTDSGYQIAGGNPISGLINKIQPKTSEKCNISLTEVPDGGTIRRSDYIEVEKREN